MGPIASLASGNFFNTAIARTWEREWRMASREEMAVFLEGIGRIFPLFLHIFLVFGRY